MYLKIHTFVLPLDNTHCKRDYEYNSLCRESLLRIPSYFSHVQVGVLGDEEEWVSLQEVENEPDAQMLEIPNLTPYTHYR